MNDDEWWRMMTNDDEWWRMMTNDDEWWRMMMNDDEWWWIMMNDDEWWGWRRWRRRRRRRYWWVKKIKMLQFKICRSSGSRWSPSILPGGPEKIQLLEGPTWLLETVPGAWNPLRLKTRPEKLAIITQPNGIFGIWQAVLRVLCGNFSSFDRCPGYPFAKRFEGSWRCWKRRWWDKSCACRSISDVFAKIYNWLVVLIITFVFHPIWDCYSRSKVNDSWTSWCTL